jgi:hypothetical protein
MTFPGTSATIARTDAAQTFTGVQTFSSTIAGSINGNAATVTTNANLTGDVTSVGNATTIGTGKVVTGMIADAAVTTVKITDANVTEGKLATDAVTSAKIKDGEIVNADISASAAIVDTKLATIATSGKVSNSATTATNANTALAIVARDSSGNFTAGTITADLSGNATSATNIAGGAAGSLPYQSAAATTAMLAVGANGQVLTLAGGIPSWSYSSGSVVVQNTTPYTIRLQDSFVFYTGGSNGAFTLPTGVTGKEITIKNKTANTITISGTSIYVDKDNTAVTSVAVGNEASNNWIRLVFDGTQWVVFRALF